MVRDVTNGLLELYNGVRPVVVGIRSGNTMDHQVRSANLAVQNLRSLIIRLYGA